MDELDCGGKEVCVVCELEETRRLPPGPRNLVLWANCGLIGSRILLKMTGEKEIPLHTCVILVLLVPLDIAPRLRHKGHSEVHM